MREFDWRWSGKGTAVPPKKSSAHGHTPTADRPGALVAELRAAREWSQTVLARRAHISLSLLRKIEVGDRTLSPQVASSLGRALGFSMADVLEGRQPYRSCRAAPGCSTSGRARL
ncbi:helix-turn-helix domain-containing protein [Streptomyces alfalfae]